MNYNYSAYKFYNICTRQLCLSLLILGLSDHTMLQNLYLWSLSLVFLITLDKFIQLRIVTLSNPQFHHHSQKPITQTLPLHWFDIICEIKIHQFFTMVHQHTKLDQSQFSISIVRTCLNNLLKIRNKEWKNFLYLFWWNLSLNVSSSIVTYQSVKFITDVSFTFLKFSIFLDLFYSHLVQ